MQLSKHNIISKLRDSEDYFIVNPLYQTADILSREEGEALLQGKTNDEQSLLERGYLVNELDEKKAYREAYLEFIDNRESDEVQIFYVLSYGCNFTCSYCYQSKYIDEPVELTNKTIDAFFTYIQDKFAGRRKYITLFGGEPFLPSARHKEFFRYFIRKVKESQLDLAIVTNGYLLEEYLDELEGVRLREIQVTLDGPEDVHNKRRRLGLKGASFEKIVRGIDKSLARNVPINLRAVVDKENIHALPELARFAITRGWTKNTGFKTQLGRNYELHYCQKEQNQLYTRIEMYEDIYKILLENPDFIEFHKPAFSISKFIFENGELPAPLFDSCPGTKTEWAFDYSGKIYSCTATVGKPGEALGTYYPTVELYDEIIEAWQERDVLSIDKCNNCSLQLACGGGCASVAKNQSGTVNAPDCRPVKELLELGIAYYAKNQI